MCLLLIDKLLLYAKRVERFIYKCWVTLSDLWQNQNTDVKNENQILSMLGNNIMFNSQLIMVESSGEVMEMSCHNGHKDVMKNFIKQAVRHRLTNTNVLQTVIKIVKAAIQVRMIFHL
jgi:hypothetical protein